MKYDKKNINFGKKENQTLIQTVKVNGGIS
jgi:hypothetical protein